MAAIESIHQGPYESAQLRTLIGATGNQSVRGVDFHADGTMTVRLGDKHLHVQRALVAVGYTVGGSQVFVGLLRPLNSQLRRMFGPRAVQVNLPNGSFRFVDPDKRFQSLKRSELAVWAFDLVAHELVPTPKAAAKPAPPAATTKEPLAQPTAPTAQATKPRSTREQSTTATARTKAADPKPSITTGQSSPRRRRATRPAGGHQPQQTGT